MTLPRQQTLQSLIDWSYDLLSEAEKALLCRLSVFAGGWTLETAETVCAGDPIEEGETADLLSSLVDKSLVVAETKGSAGRYRLLETVRQYAGDRLLERQAEPDMPDMRERHLACFLALAEEAAPQLRGAEQQAWLERLESEHDNLRVAMSGGGGGERQMRIAASLCHFWTMHSHVSEGRARCSDLFEQGKTLPPSPALGSLLNCAGVLAYVQSDYPAARSYYTRAAAVKSHVGDRRGEAGTLANLASVSQAEEDYSSARTQFERSLAIQRELGDTQAVSIFLTCLGNVLREMDEPEAAHEQFQEAILLYRERGDRANEANTLNLLGICHRVTGARAAARDAYQQALSINRELGIKYEAAHNLANLAVLSREEGNLTEAKSYYAESLSLHVLEGSRRHMALCFDGLATLDALRELPGRAARLLGAAEMCLGEVSSKHSSDSNTAEELADDLRRRLGKPQFDAEFTRGRSMTMDQAIALVMQEGNA